MRHTIPDETTSDTMEANHVEKQVYYSRMSVLEAIACVEYGIPFQIYK